MGDRALGWVAVVVVALMGGMIFREGFDKGLPWLLVAGLLVGAAAAWLADRLWRDR